MAFAPIPVRVPIIDSARCMTIFFRQRWEELRLAAQRIGALATFTLTGQVAGSVGTVAATVTSGGLYQLSYMMRRTIADGISSQFRLTWNWTHLGVPVSKAMENNTTDTTGSVSSEVIEIYADANTNITFDRTYASNTPAKMTYALYGSVKQVVQA